jgi:peptidoglycan/xylan/chitin deacetylase (PgdA/CDA1 family)
MISIMFHSAGLRDHPWRSAHVSEPLDILRDKLEVIREEGYRTITMDEAAAHFSEKRDNLLHLTFDDGYLDNWVHIFPILERLELKATIYMSTDFIEPGDRIREQREIYERNHDPIGCCAGFLSFSEMRAMEDSGLVEIQSHAMTHTWYPSSPDIVDFWHPGSATESGGPVWMLWNLFPEKKPYYLSEAAELESSIPYGTPVYEPGKSLESVRYFPDEAELETELVNAVGDRAQDFFTTEGWADILMSIVAEYRSKAGVLGRYETAEEYNRRISGELSGSKEILEGGLGHEVNGICWPGGGVTKDVMLLARKAGYEYLNLPSKWKGLGHHLEFHGMISRITSLPRIFMRGKDLGYPSKRDFRDFLRASNGYKTSRLYYDLSRFRRYVGV